jgi:hypothetical protein
MFETGFVASMLIDRRCRERTFLQIEGSSRRQSQRRQKSDTRQMYLFGIEKIQRGAEKKQIQTKIGQGLLF